MTQMLDQILWALRRWKHKRATTRALTALSDWQLRDLGITRGQIPEIVEDRLNAEVPAPTRSAAPVARVGRQHAMARVANDDSDTPLAA